MKVLIVDDSKPILMMVSDILKELGHEPLTAENGEIAFEMLTSGQQIDLVLLDWNMPVMTGIEFLEKNKAESAFSTPVFMMTTEKSPEKIQRALENGASDYIMKPFTPDILQNKIEMLQELLG
ncbi:MAG: response regulator [Deltaproteobacteria bacterium]|nr:MAG: response regulator [Deltaproteobacteria bacterium]TNF24669.1 MAG: response regulator [Deltaproteobacteria bacterium]